MKALKQARNLLPDMKSTIRSVQPGKGRRLLRFLMDWGLSWSSSSEEDRKRENSSNLRLKCMKGSEIVVGDDPIPPFDSLYYS
jgi:hypothetical protein